MLQFVWRNDIKILFKYAFFLINSLLYPYTYFDSIIQIDFNVILARKYSTYSFWIPFTKIAQPNEVKKRINKKTLIDLEKIDTAISYKHQFVDVQIYEEKNIIYDKDSFLLNKFDFCFSRFV